MTPDSSKLVDFGPFLQHFCDFVFQLTKGFSSNKQDKHLWNLCLQKSRKTQQAICLFSDGSRHPCNSTRNVPRSLKTSLKTAFTASLLAVELQFNFFRQRNQIQCHWKREVATPWRWHNLLRWYYYEGKFLDWNWLPLQKKLLEQRSTMKYMDWIFFKEFL